MRLLKTVILASARENQDLTIKTRTAKLKWPGSNAPELWFDSFHRLAPGHTGGAYRLNTCNSRPTIANSLFNRSFRTSFNSKSRADF
ncbi:hypothetical protein PM082_023451 [Marasmius tenuissimus]|nr:hypothetical protein PM082_023451 [Marasmius tenuissimus]